VNARIDAVRDYLASRLTNARIEINETPDGPHFVIRRGDLDWSVLFTNDFLNSAAPEQLPARLHELHLIEELAAVEDLPLVVEPTAIRLLSNN